MKLFVFLLFSGFVYAQEPNKSDGPAQPDSGSQKESAPPSVAPPEQNPQKDQAPQKDSSREAPKLPPNSEKQMLQKNNKEGSSAQPANEPQAVAVPPQPLSAPPEEPVPYYNPLHPQSASAYQEGDLPSEEYSNMTALKDRRHRFSISGRLFDYRMQGDKKKINLNFGADYGYSRKYFEAGPYASIDVSDLDVGADRFQDVLLLDVGAFVEVNFASNTSQKNTPSIGLKAGYKRKQNMNYLVGQTYASMKFFLNHQTAFFVSLAPYLQYKWQGQTWEWGVEIPAGLRFYFY